MSAEGAPVGAPKKCDNRRQSSSCHGGRAEPVNHDVICNVKPRAIVPAGDTCQDKALGTQASIYDKSADESFAQKV